MANKKLICTNVVCKNPNLNIILSIISIVWIWRGVWGLTDALVFISIPLDIEHLVGYGLPVLIGFAYVYFNDYSISELKHPSPND